jgi:hypothetical protein
MLIEKILEKSKSGFRNILKQFDKIDFSSIKYIVFIIGLVFYIITRINLVAAPIIENSIFLEPGDAYNFIVTGIQTRTCFLQDCVALEDFREQLKVPSPETKIAELRNRQYHRLFTYYYPLYSFLFAGIYSIGFTPDITYIILSIFGIILTNLAIVYILYSVWGPGPAGIALVILANSPPTAIAGHSPSDIATGIAIISWAIIINNPKRKFITIPLFILAMSAMHTIGLLYSFVTLTLILLLSTLPYKKRIWMVLGFNMIIILTFFFILPHISRPDFKMYDPSSFFTGDWNRKEALLKSIKFAINNLKFFGTTIPGLLSAGLLILFGMYNNTRRRNEIIAIGGLLAGLYLISAFYIDPWYPGVITRRVWAPFRIFLIGAIGCAIWVWAKKFLGDLLANNRLKINNVDKTNPIMSFLLKDIVIYTVIVFVFIGNTCVYNESLNGVQSQIEKEELIYLSYWLDPGQPELLQSQIKNDEFVLYIDEVPMFFYLFHGALNNHAVYYTSLYGTPEQEKWIDGNEKIRYVVTVNPVNSEPNPSSRVGQTIVPRFINGKQLIIESDSQFNLSEVELLLINPGNQDEILDIKYTDGGMNEIEYKAIVPSGGPNWFAINNQKEVWVNQLIIDVEKQPLNLILEGIHIKENETLNWPWDQGITIKLIDLKNPKKEPIVIPFKSEILDGRLELKLQVIADDGVSVLSEVIP